MRKLLVSAALQAVGVFLILAASTGTAFGVEETCHSPEIDPGSAASALTMLVGGMLLFVDRIRRR
jgi:hypothetical protein